MITHSSSIPDHPDYVDECSDERESPTAEQISGVIRAMQALTRASASVTRFQMMDNIATAVAEIGGVTALNPLSEAKEVKTKSWKKNYNEADIRRRLIDKVGHGLATCEITVWADGNITINIPASHNADVANYNIRYKTLRRLQKAFKPTDLAITHVVGMTLPDEPMMPDKDAEDKARKALMASGIRIEMTWNGKLR